ncbi:MAG: InlB B-repeat-containing protein, partial [Oscillospiraceae bacterium]|nr:InlB B-repeat-containing protein [Oscillospiraceae bacterium]
MKNYSRRFLALLIALVMVVGLFPAAAFAATPAGAEPSDAVRVFTAEDEAILKDDVFARIDEVKTTAAKTRGGIGALTEADYAALVPQVVKAVEASETYVPGTLHQNGSFLSWETTVGLPCCYSPRMEAELHNTENDPTPEEIARAEEEAQALLDRVTELKGGSAGSMNIGLIQPYWESSSSYSDSSFLNYSPTYKALWQSLYTATGGTGIRYSMTNANVDNVASTLTQCGLVIFDSHGTTDYDNGYDYTSRANSSYLCLTTSTGVTSADAVAQTGPYGTYYHVYSGGSYAYVDGTCIANHMNGNAPHSLLYMGICLGMATDGMHAPLRAKGVEVAYGYSQSVTFVGEKAYIQAILTDVMNGANFSTAVNNAKASVGPWDAYSSHPTEADAVADYTAFPIVVSSEDVYPGHGNVDAVQNVYSTWVLQGDSYEVSAVPNDPSYGSVSVVGYNVFAEPAAGYYTEGYTLLEGTASVTQSGNNFILEPTSDCVLQVNFAPKSPATVSYVANGVVQGTENSYLGDDVILPTQAAEIEDWTFVGWMTDTLAVTDDKPAYYKPGAACTVTSVNQTFYALYSYLEGDGSSCYRLVTETPDEWAGRYVISSAADANMRVMYGVSGNVNIEQESSGYTTLAAAGITLEEDILLNVADDYLFQVAEQSGSAYSFQSVSAGSWLAVYSSYLRTRENYESAYCNWTLSAAANGVLMRCTASTSYPYLIFNGTKFAAGGESQKSPIQLWKESPFGTVYYCTNPETQGHEHVLEAHPAKAPTCGAEGNSAYWQCSVCLRCFSDAAGENEIALASTVIPATGAHSFETWSANNDGTHSSACAVCGQASTESCSYDEVVTPPTATQQGYTTYTCTVCGYSYVGSFTQPLGENHTVHFEVPGVCAPVDDMICNSVAGITLPAVEAPEGYQFLGWVDAVCDNVETRPAQIYTGSYVTDRDVTLYALFQYVISDGSGETGFHLVTEPPDSWEGNYVISYQKNSASMFVMNGLSAGTSYEVSNGPGAVAFANTGMTMAEDGVLTGVADAYIFEVAREDNGLYSIRNTGVDSYLAISGELMALGSYTASTCGWNLSMTAEGYVSAKLAAGGTWPYLAFTTGGNKFWCLGNTNSIFFWKQAVAGTTYWTTVIGESGGDDYIVSFSVLGDVDVIDPMVCNAQTSITLPTAEGPEGYRFLGWVEEDYNNVTELPETILTGEYTPAGNVTLLALFTYNDYGGNPPTLTLMTVNDSFSDGDKIVIVESGGTHGLYQKAHNYAYVSDFDFTEDAEEILADELKYFNVTQVEGGWYLGDEVNGWLYTPDNQTNLTIRYNTAFMTAFTLTTYEGHLALQHTVSYNDNVFYVNCGTNLTGALTNKWRMVNANNMSGISTLNIYKLNEGGAALARYTTMLHSHTPGDPVVENTAAATCTEAGGYDTVVYCSVCGVELSREHTVVPALGHDYQAVVTEPTCTAGGFTTYTCSRCGDSYTGDETAALGHDYQAVVTEPTCTAGGYTTHSCSRCGDTYTDSETDPLGHDYGDWTVTTVPTCTEAGVETRTCSRCDAAETRPVEALGHDYNAVVTEPTCTEGGFTTYTCSRCGDSYTGDETEPLGHDFGDWTVTTAPSCTEAGVETRTCSRC